MKNEEVYWKGSLPTAKVDEEGIVVPHAQVTQRVEFAGIKLIVTPDVMIPRGGSVALVDIALEHLQQLLKKPRILDLGTGSGCLLLAIVSRLNDNFEAAIGVDVSEEALKVARDNSKPGSGSGSSFFLGWSGFFHDGVMAAACEGEAQS